MRQWKWLTMLVAVLAMGLIAAGCGDDEDSSSDPAATTSEAESTAEDTEPTEEPTTEDSGSSDGSSPDDVYNACIDVIEESGAAGTAAEDAGKTACEQARSAFEQCLKQAEASGDSDAAEIAIKACQNAADQTVAALEAGTG